MADISYATITKCHFWSDFSQFQIENVHTSIVEVIGGLQKKVQNRVWLHLKPPKTIEVNKKYTQICPDFVLQPWDDWHKKILLCKLENGQLTYLRTVKYVQEYTVILLYYTQWNRMELLCWFFVGGEILLTHMIFLYHWTS